MVQDCPAGVENPGLKLESRLRGLNASTTSHCSSAVPRGSLFPGRQLLPLNSESAFLVGIPLERQPQGFPYRCVVARVLLP